MRLILVLFYLTVLIFSVNAQTIIDFRISYKSNKYNYSNGGGSEFVFEFSCEKKAWILLTRTSRGL